MNFRGPSLKGLDLAGVSLSVLMLSSWMSLLFLNERNLGRCQETQDALPLQQGEQYCDKRNMPITTGLRRLHAEDGLLSHVCKGVGECEYVCVHMCVYIVCAQLFACEWV